MVALGAPRRDGGPVATEAVQPDESSGSGSDELLEIAELFSLGDIVRVTPGPRGAMGQITRLDADTGSWALKRLFALANAASVENETRIQEASVAAGVRAPTPRRTRDGQIIGTVGGSSYRMWNWVETAETPTAPATQALAGELGVILATIHRLRLPPPGPVGPWLSSRPPAERWGQILLDARTARAPWAPLLVDTLPNIRDLEKVADLVETRDPVLCHNDMGPGNVAIDGAGHAVVLDWEHAGAQNPGQELGYVLVAWAEQNGLVAPEAASALAAGYRSVAEFPCAVGPAMFGGIAGAVLNFACGQARASLTATDADHAAFATANISSFARHPLTLSSIETIIDAIS